jgi:Co/Zn/Cd efflux system component
MPTSQRAVIPGGELRRAVSLVAILNLAYFTIEVAVARAIGSVSLFADSIDFLEDATVNGIILLAVRWHPRRRGAVGMVLAAILLIPGLATVFQAWEKLAYPSAPSPIALSVAALGALAVNLFCAYTLARVRHAGGSLSRAAFLSARNDVLANIGMISAGALTAVWQTVWPDLLVGLAILVMNLDAARQVYMAARRDLSIS